jgi:hypothetical protein
MSISRLCATAVAVAAFALGSFATAPATKAAILFKVSMSGAEMVSPTDVTGTGQGTFRLTGSDQTNYRLAYDLVFSPDFDFGLPSQDGLEVTRLSIHRGPFGTNGSLVFDLLGGSQPDPNLTATLLFDGATRLTGAWDAADGIATTSLALFADETSDLPLGFAPYYLNLRAEGFPAGAIRGQFTVVPLPAPALLLGGALLLLFRLRRTGSAAQGEETVTGHTDHPGPARAAARSSATPIRSPIPPQRCGRRHAARTPSEAR